MSVVPVEFLPNSNLIKTMAEGPSPPPECNVMTESVVHEWLADYGALSPVEVHSFASSLEHDQNVVAALYNVLEERNKFQELIDPVCNQLFGFYRSREVELQRFTLQFLPTLIFVYLNSVAHNDKKNCRSVETLLIGLYNLEVMDENGQPKVISFRLPSLAQASVYHEPMSLAPASLTESALRRLEECNTKLVNWGPLPQVEGLNAQNRLKVMTALLFVYNRQLSLLHKSALKALCKVSSKLVTQGFSKLGHHQRSSYGSDSSFVPRLLPRIPVSSQFLLEFMHAIYYALFNEFGYLATPALEDIYTRGCYEGYAEVALVSSAIKNSLHLSSSGQPCDGPMGISVALSPATTTVTTVSKSMITNASFRTKKLPDDIPIVPKDDGAADGNKSLMAISEEQEEPAGAPSEKLTPRGSSLRGSKDAGSGGTPVGKNLPKLPTFPGLGKKAKDKDKDGKAAAKNGVTPERKESVESRKESKGKEGKGLTSRGSLLNVVLNGDTTEADSPQPPVRKKDSTNSELGANGTVSSSLALEMEKLVTDSTAAVSVGQGVAADFVEERTEKAIESQVPHKKLDVDRLSMQVSSV